MPFPPAWTQAALDQYDAMKQDAQRSVKARQAGGKKPSNAEGLFKQVHGCIQKLANDPRHPGLKTHKFYSLELPYDPAQPVFEAYAQNKTPGAYRAFWCYGPDRREITIIAITPHP